MTVEEFAGEFFQDVLAEADADGQFVEDVFFHKFCEHLMEAGELDSADRAAYQGQPGKGIRVDGYGGDPTEDDSDTFSLLISDFHPSADVGPPDRNRDERDLPTAFQLPSACPR